MKKLWKSYIDVKRSERLAIEATLFLLILIFILPQFFKPKNSASNLQNFKSEITQFQNQIKERAKQDSLKRDSVFRAKRKFGRKKFENKFQQRKPTVHRQQSGRLSSTVNLNSCTEIQLDSLPGLGVVFSKRIIKYRDKVLKGKFDSIEQVKNVYGIDSILYEKISPYLKIE